MAQHELEHAASTKEPAATRYCTLGSGKLKGTKRNTLLNKSNVLDAGACPFVMPKSVALKKSPEYND